MIFCDHKWETVTEQFLPSVVERFVNMGMHKFSVTFDDYLSTHILVIKCIHCGKIKKFVTKY